MALLRSTRSQISTIVAKRAENVDIWNCSIGKWTEKRVGKLLLKESFVLVQWLGSFRHELCACKEDLSDPLFLVLQFEPGTGTILLLTFFVARSCRVTRLLTMLLQVLTEPLCQCQSVGTLKKEELTNCERWEWFTTILMTTFVFEGTRPLTLQRSLALPNDNPTFWLLSSCYIWTHFPPALNRSMHIFFAPIRTSL